MLQYLPLGSKRLKLPSPQTNDYEDRPSSLLVILWTISPHSNHALMSDVGILGAFLNCNNSLEVVWILVSHSLRHILRRSLGCPVVPQCVPLLQVLVWTGSKSEVA